MIRSPFLACTLLLATAPLEAQVDGRHLRPGTDTLTISYQGQVIGRSILVTRAVKENGADAWSQAYHFRSAQGSESWDSLWVDARSLLPLRELRGSDGERTVIRWSRTAVTTVDHAAGDSTTHTTDLTGAVHASASLAEVASALPLAAGFNTSVTFFYPRPSTYGAVATTMQVTGPETVQVRGRGARKAWVVSTYGAAGRSVFWVDVKDRSVLQFDTYEGMARIEFRR
jgi:hypothetical protein